MFTRTGIMSTRVYYIKNKLPGLFYAFTMNGVELPVLDITHPEFISSIDENKLKKMLPYIEKNAENNANKFNRMPAFIQKYFAKHSFAMAELLGNESSFASGISNLMMKMGPNLIGKGKRRFWDRQVTKGFGSLVIRMRMRDISLCQASAPIPLLQKSPERDLCFVNIEGGAALKISTTIKPRLLGIDGLKNIIEKNHWNLNGTIEGNPRYLIFALSKDLEK